MRARCWFVHALIGFSVHGSLTIKGKVMLKFWHSTPWVFDLFGYYRNFESKIGPKKEKKSQTITSFIRNCLWPHFGYKRFSFVVSLGVLGITFWLQKVSFISCFIGYICFMHIRQSLRCGRCENTSA